MTELSVVEPDFPKERAIMAKTGMSYQAAINVLAKGGHPAAGAAARA